jgi:hypothetical protein
MNTKNSQINITNNNSMADNIKILFEFTKKDIEKSYKLDTIKGTEAYFSNRYGWTLRRTED